jgi:glycosyltransferase involved in cell wall biosynthesis
MKSPKVILSTGHGRLHFIETAEALSKLNCKVDVLTGWVPPLWFPNCLIDFFGKYFNRDKLSQRLRVRRRFFLAASNSYSLALEEAKYHFSIFWAKYVGNDTMSVRANAWASFGRASIPYLKGDIFHVRSGAGQGGAIAQAKKRGMKVIVDHSIAHPKTVSDKLSKLYAKHGLPCPYSIEDPFWKQICADIDSGDSILVNSEYVKSTLIASGCKAHKIQVIYLGVREDFSGLKTNYTTKHKDFRLLFTGSFGLRKGADLIIGAVEELKKSGLNVIVEVAGDSTEGEKLLQDRPHLCSHFIFHGFVPQERLKKLLQEADAYLFPSYVEGSAKSVMEAMSAGLPVICSKETGSPISSGVTGIILEETTTYAICEKIKLLINDERLRKQLGEAATQQIATSYGWNNYAEALKNLYTNTCKL